MKGRKSIGMERNPVMATTLTDLRPGELAQIVAVQGGYGLRQKLSLRGLLEGSVVRIISCQGPITVEVNRNIVAVGRGMARKIMVRRM
jgi:ferrous iron transport protein A